VGKLILAGNGKQPEFGFNTSTGGLLKKTATENHVSTGGFL
jgi:hypothetical protein